MGTFDLGSYLPDSENDARVFQDRRLSDEQHAQLLAVCAQTGKTYDELTLCDGDSLGIESWGKIVIDRDAYARIKAKKDREEAELAADPQWIEYQGLAAQSDADFEASMVTMREQFSQMLAEGKEQELARNGDPEALKKYTPGKLPETFDIDAAYTFVTQRAKQLLDAQNIADFSNTRLLEHTGGGVSFDFDTGEQTKLPEYVGLKANDTPGDYRSVVYICLDNGQIYTYDQTGELMIIQHEGLKNLLSEVLAHQTKLSLTAQKELDAAINAELLSIDPENKYPEHHHTLRAMLQYHANYVGYVFGRSTSPIQKNYDLVTVEIDYDEKHQKLSNAVQIPGVRFYTIGHNASHFFAAGFKEGNFYSRASTANTDRLIRYVNPDSGEFIDDEDPDAQSTIDSFDVCDPKKMFGAGSYWGHM